MNSSFFKDTLRTIRKNLSRYISILLIVALGTAFFVGIKATSPDMLSNARSYFSEYNLADIRIQSSIGLTDTDLNALKGLEGVEYASGVRFVDAFVLVNGEAQLDIDGTQITTRAYSISPSDIYNFTHGVNDGAYMNRVQLIDGRFPQQKNECLVDQSRLSTPDSFRLGSVITLQNGGNELPEELSVGEFTVVGIIRSPFYLSFERGNTDIGSGKLGTFIVIPEEAFATDYYTEVYLKVLGSEDYEPFSDAYFEYTDSYLKTVQAASPNLIAQRVNELRPKLQSEITEAEKKIKDSETESQNYVNELNKAIDTLQPLVDNGAQLVAAAEAEFNSTFSQVETELNSNSTAYQQALADYTTKRQELAAAQTAYDAKQAQLTAAKETYDTLYAQYNNATAQVATLQSQISTTTSLIDAAQSLVTQIGDTQATAYSNDQIQSIVTMMQGTYPDLYNSVKSLTTSGLAGEIVANVSPYLDQQKQELAKQQEELDQFSQMLTTLGDRLTKEQETLQTATKESQEAYQKLQTSSTELDTYLAVLTQQGYNIQSGSVELAVQKMQKESELNELKAKVEAAPAQLQEAVAKRDEILAQTESTLAFAKSELADAKSLFAKLDNVTWNVYDRENTPGYTSYGQSVNNIEILSDIFPIFFFLISSLVCLTTVTRLVEEDRTLLGTYKALGYEDTTILFKYVAYSLSACVFGSAVGISIGVFLFPYMINAAYSVMYSLPEITYQFPFRYAFVGFAIALLSTAIVTFAAVLRDLRLKPAVLMRPKSPKKGKKILLEHIRFIWTRLSFTAKVTARNLFRNKSRFLMTLAGIAGCTALLLASLGFYNSISAIKAEQYDGADAISKYDLQVVFDNPQTSPLHTAEYTAASSDARVAAMTLVSMKSMIGFSSHSNTKLDVYVFVPESPESMPLFIDLRDRKTGNKITMDDTGAVITEKLAQDTGTNVGDSINIQDSNGNVFVVKVAAIAENYTFHYIYFTPTLYQTTVGAPPTYNYAIGNISDSIKASKQTDLANIKGLLANDLMKIDGVTTVAYLSETTESIGEITNALSTVIWVFFVSALILAFVVLYNLTNINIIERTRELATLKVLGFNDTEVNRYILRENIVVSLFGILFGIGLGILLHHLLITYTAIDTVMYGQRIYIYSYLIAIGITVLFIFGVNLLLRRKTVKIDMVESLKSVE